MQGDTDISDLNLQEKDAEYIEVLVKKAFDLENDKKDKMLSNLNAIVAAFAGIFAGIGILFTKLPPIDGFWSHVILISFVVNVIIIIKAFLVSYNLFSGENYMNFHDPNDLFSDVKRFNDYLSHVDNGKQDGRVKHELRINMIACLADAVTINRRINERRLLLRVDLYRYFCKAAGLIAILFVVEYLHDNSNIMDVRHVKQLLGFVMLIVNGP